MEFFSRAVREFRAFGRSAESLSILPSSHIAHEKVGAVIRLDLGRMTSATTRPDVGRITLEQRFSKELPDDRASLAKAWKLLESYSGIPPDEIEKHVTEIVSSATFSNYCRLGVQAGSYLLTFPGSATRASKSLRTRASASGGS